MNPPDRRPAQSTRRSSENTRDVVADVVIAGASPFDLYLAHELTRSGGLAVCNLDPSGEWLGIWATDCERLGIERVRDRNGERRTVTDLRDSLIDELVDERTPVAVPPGREWAATPHGVVIEGDRGSIVARYAVATPPTIRDVPQWCVEVGPFPPARFVHVDDLQIPVRGERLLIAGAGPLAAHLDETARRCHAHVAWAAASERPPAPARVPTGAELSETFRASRSRVMSARWHGTAWLVVSGDERRLEVDDIWLVVGDRSRHCLDGQPPSSRTRWIIGKDGPMVPCRTPQGAASDSSSLAGAQAAARWTAEQMAEML